MHSECSHFQIVECNQCCKLEGVGTFFALTEIETKKQALSLNENVCVEIRRHYLQTPSISTLRTRKN